MQDTVDIVLIAGDLAVDDPVEIVAKVNIHRVEIEAVAEGCKLPDSGDEPDSAGIKEKERERKRRGSVPLRKLIRLFSRILLIMAACVACSSAASAEELTIHFLDVGQADAALLLCGGQSMLIDGGNADDSGLIYSYLKNHGVSHLDYIICTHPDEDHVGGLSGALNYAAVDKVYCSTDTWDSRYFRNFVKYLRKQGKTITVPEPGENFRLGTATVELLGPLRKAEKQNNNSIVTRVTFGTTSFLFAGDAETEEENDLLEAKTTLRSDAPGTGSALRSDAPGSGTTLRSDVLKVGHHGSRYSTGREFLQAVKPKYAVISVGAGNSFGHPSAQTISRLRAAGAEIYRTDLNGTVVCSSDGTKITFSAEKKSSTGQSGTSEAGESEAEAAGADQSEAAEEGQLWSGLLNFLIELKKAIQHH